MAIEKQTPRLNKVLLLEDDVHLRQGIALTLQFDNFEVYQAASGEHGLEILRSVTPDLIISDINMPHMNGLDFFKTLRKNPNWTQIPFIFLTGKNASQDIQFGRELGIEDYITKPIQAENLLRIVNARLLRAAEIRASFLNEAFLETIQVLSNTIEGKDKYTSGHVERVSKYANWFGERLGWPEEQLIMLKYGARLHDIGKISVPDHILNKMGKLDAEEWVYITKHPVEGARIIDKISLLTDALPYIRSHHEKWDGSGYPDGLNGLDIPIEGRMLAIVDVFDALTTTRSYRPALSFRETMDFIISRAGIEFDPSLVSVFTEVVEEHIRPLFEV